MNNIMIIDDSMLILKMSKAIIETNMDNCEVTPMANPKEAMELLLKKRFQVIILDIVMPEISGIEVLQWIKEQEELEHIKVIMFSSIRDSKSFSECFRLGAYDYIGKPLEENEFVVRLKHAINEYKQAEIIQSNLTEQRMMNSKLLELNQSLKSAQSELIQSEKLAGIGHLAAGMAHEINNPLGFLISNISTLQQDVNNIMLLHKELSNEISGSESDVLTKAISSLEEKYDYAFISEDVGELFGDINHGLKRITGIIDALRKFSVVDSMTEKELVDIKSAIDNILTMIEGRYLDKIKVDCRIDITSSVYLNRAEFNMAIFELIRNAIDAIMEKSSIDVGKIIIRGIEGDEWIEMEIEDTGVGMGEEVKKHAFDPFYTTKEVGEGVGLGLATTYNYMVNILKGFIGIDSMVGRGTIVMIRFPKGVDLSE